MKRTNNAKEYINAPAWLYEEAIYKAVVYRDGSSLSYAFGWGSSLEGWNYWASVYAGVKIPLDHEALNRLWVMYRLYQKYRKWNLSK